MELYTQYLLWAFGLALVFGVIAAKTHFCTMGAVSDWINIGDLSRMRTWMLAIATAIIGVGILEYFGSLDLSLTTSNETSNPPYRSANFIWMRHLIGGAMFGVGMTLASGCGNKTLVRLGGGNLKSIIVLVTIAIATWFMLFTNFGYHVFLQWMLPSSIDFSLRNIESQEITAVVVGLAGSEKQTSHALVAALVIGGALLAWVLRASDFRTNFELMAAGIAIGAIIVIAWWVTAGPQGLLLLEELDFMDERPFFAGAQSMTFIGPTGHAAQYLKEGFDSLYLTFGIATIGGVAIGAFIYSLWSRQLRLEWFVSWKDFVAHVCGGALMGMGGVLALGCTIGQGISGISTLALGSFVSVVAIIAASAATMKYQYYLMMREDD